MIDTSGIFKIDDPNTETLGELQSQLGGILAVGTRSDGRYYLSDLCQADSINSFARFKPEDYDKPANLTLEERIENKFGFGDTPMIEPRDADIPHAVYVYRKPKGGEHSMNRLRDFNGYNHKAGSPLSIEWPKGKIQRDQLNHIIVKVNFQIDRWDARSCMKMGEIMDNASQRYYLALLVNNGRHSYVLPSNIPVSRMREDTYILATFLFAKNADLFGDYSYLSDIVFPFVIPDMEDDDEDTKYTIAVVACATPYNGVDPVDQYPVKSMEIKYGIDRKEFSVATSEPLDGLYGYLSPEWRISEGSTVNSFTPFYLDGTKLYANLTTTSEWRRTFAYIAVEIWSDYGFITGEDGDDPENRINVLTVGKEIRINANVNGSYEIADLSGYTIWAAAPADPKTITIRLLAYQNSSMVGDPKVLDVRKETI